MENKKSMTFEDYIKNPIGGSVVTNRQMFETLYSNKLDNILVRENGIINYQLFIDKNIYYAYIKIPSEVVPNFYYDIVIKFTPPDKIFANDSNLMRYNVQFFSNDPAFVFTFAYAFKKKKMFINELSPKMSNEAITTVAKEKNPNKQIGYVKSLFFAYLIMKNRNLFSKLKFDSEAKVFSLPALLKQIENADQKIHNRQEQGKQIEQKKKKEKGEPIKTPTRTIIKNKTNTKTGITSISRIGSISSINKSNRSKRIGTVKRK